MKRLSVAILISFLLLPTCGGVWTASAEENGHETPHHHAGGHSASEEAHSAIIHSEGARHSEVKTFNDSDHPHIKKVPVANCCGENHGTIQIGYVERKPTEIVVKTHAFAIFPIVPETESGVFTIFENRPPTAPPDRHGYAALVGIVKNLD